MVGLIMLVIANQGFSLIFQIECEIQDLLVQTSLTLRVYFVIFFFLTSHFAGQHSLARLTCGGVYVTTLRNGPNVRACCGFWLHLCSTWGGIGMYYDFLSMKIRCRAR